MQTNKTADIKELERLQAEREAAWLRVCDAAKVYNAARDEYRAAVNTEYAANKAANKAAA